MITPTVFYANCTDPTAEANIRADLGVNSLDETSRPTHRTSAVLPEKSTDLRVYTPRRPARGGYAAQQQAPENPWWGHPGATPGYAPECKPITAVLPRQLETAWAYYAK